MSLDNIEQVVFNPNLYLDGCELQWIDDSTVSISTGVARDQNNIVDIFVNSILSVSTEISGIGGLDFGTLENNTVYFVYLIADARGFNPTSALFSKNRFGLPYMPQGYSVVRRVGRIRTNGSSDILKFYSYASSGRDRFIQLDTPLSLVNGGTSDTFSNFSTQYSSYNDIANVVFINYVYTGSVLGHRLSIRPYGSSAAFGFCPINAYCNVATRLNYGSMVPILPVVDGNGVSMLEYAVDSGDSVEIDIAGYMDRL